MDIRTFIDRYYEAFSQKAELPIAMWYSDEWIGEEIKTRGCMFKAFYAVRNGTVLSFCEETIGCGGGNFYTGFTPMGEHIPKFVSLKEHYKNTPDSVIECINCMNVQQRPNKYLHFARIDKINSFNEVEGLIFFATPDILTGLCAWIFWDNNSPDAVCTLFNSGCSATITNTINENREKGKRTFLGLLDPSVRPYFESNILSLSIPMSRFRELYDTLLNTCLLNNVAAWKKVRDRISEKDI